MGIEADYVERHPNSRRLAERARRVLPSGVTHDARYLRPFPIAVERAAGSRKWDVDGHELIDYVMGHGALLLGHAHPAVTEAVVQQARRGTHYGAGHELEVRWAELVCRLVPSAEAVRFTSSGTEATLMALRLARAATSRPTVVKFERHFHGWHDYVAAAARYDGAAPAGIPEEALGTVVVLPVDTSVVRETLSSRRDVAAVIVEASGASMGTIPLPLGFLRELAAVCRAAGVLLILDEVVTGFRWSPGGVQALEGIEPDLTALAKVLAGGLPGGAVAGRADLLGLLSFPEPGQPRTVKVGHPGTFNANPLSAAAGVACLELVSDGEAQRRASATARTLREGMNAVLRELGVFGAVYGQASVFRIVLREGIEPPKANTDGRDLPPEVLAAGTDAELLRLLHLAMICRGVHLFGNGGIVSAVHGEDDVARTLEAWRAALLALREEGTLPGGGR